MLLLLLLTCSLAAPQDGASASQEALERHVRTLASDDWKGRQAGTEGSRAAAAYLIAELEKAGLVGGAADGSFRQTIPVVLREHLSAPRVVFTTNAGEQVEALYGVDFNLVLRGPAQSTADLPILRVVEEEDLPQTAQPDQAVFFRCNPVERSEWLAMWGQGKAEGWGLDLQLGRSEEQGVLRAPPPRVALFDDDPVAACEVVTMRGPMRENLIWKGYKSVQLFVEERRTEVDEANVIALLPGTDPELADEIVLLQAGYDHLGEAGIGARLDQEDRVRNGANQASTLAALLELARLRAAAGDNKRTLAFVFTTGTPKLRFGWKRFVEEPPFPLERVVAGFSVDGLGLRDIAQASAGTVMLTGSGRSDLAQGLTSRGLRFVQDPYDDKLFDKRGPHRSLTRLGIPAHWVFSSPPDAKRNPWEDEAERIDFDHLTQATDQLAGALRLLGDGTLTPTAKPGRRDG